MTNGAKLEKLFAVVVLAFLFSFSWVAIYGQQAEKPQVIQTVKAFFVLGWKIF